SADAGAAPPTILGLQTGEGSRPTAPAAFGDLSGLLVGAVAGGAFAIGLAWLSGDMAQPVRGLILGALAGVLAVPLLILGVAVSAMLQPWSPNGMLADSLVSRVTRQILERNYRALTVWLSWLLLVGMGLGGFFGYRLQVAGPSLLPAAVLGGTSLGAIVGAL